MELEVVGDDEALAHAVADRIVAEGRAAIERSGLFTLALSGGSTPRRMLEVLAGVDLDWSAVHVFQVDERVAPEGHADRNLTMIVEALGSTADRLHLHPMPVNLHGAAVSYQQVIEDVCGHPAVLHCVHLGIGSDGHTASLVPDDPVLQETKADVAETGPYQGRRRLTMTAPIINRADERIWQVAGRGKADALRSLLAEEPGIPATLIERDRTVVFAETASVNGHPSGR